MVQLSINKLKTSAPYFAEHILNMKIHSGQRQVLESNARFLAIAAPRRWGKSEMAAIMSCHLAATNENCKIICISRSKGQADELFRKIYRLVSNSILIHCVTRSTQSVLEFSNGSAIESKASRDPDKIRGFQAGMVVVDESAFVGDPVFETLFPIVLNTKNKEQGRLVLISTPGVMSGEFYRAFQPGSIYETFHFTHEDAVFPDGSRLLPQSELDREGQRMGFDSTFYRREYLCQWNSTDNGFFSTDGIEKTLIPDVPQLSVGIPNHKYVIGADLAVKNDYTVFIVLDYTDKNNLCVVKHVRFHGKPADEIMLELYKLTAAFSPSKILIDEGNIGSAIVSQLKARYPSKRWEGFVFTSTSKTPLLTDLDIAMSSGILVIPDDDQIREELIAFHYEENQTTGHLKLSGSGAHDDYPIAIALAIRAANIFTKAGGLTIGSSQGILTGSKVELSKGYNSSVFV